MRYIDPRLLIPAVAITALAQQQSPEAVAAEAALRARAQEFFQLQVDKKYRQAEAMVADDTKDVYYNGKRYNIEGFTIQSIELLDDAKRAKVTIRAKTTLKLPTGQSLPVEIPQTTLWKVEGSQWVWYVEQGSRTSPFGTLEPSNGGPPSAPSSVTEAMRRNAPDAAALQQMVKIDRSAIVLSAEAPEQTVTVINNLPGAVDLEVRPDPGAAFRVDLDKKHLGAGEKALIHFTASDAPAKVSNVHVVVLPLNTTLNVQVTKK